MITVKYFANLKSIVGREEEKLDLGAETTLLKISEAISQHSPNMGELIREKKVMVSVNMEMVPLDAVIRDGDEVALLPPFSGGV